MGLTRRKLIKSGTSVFAELQSLESLLAVVSIKWLLSGKCCWLSLFVVGITRRVFNTLNLNQRILRIGDQTNKMVG